MKDLFGEYPVTWPEVWNWIEIVAGIERTSWRAAWYAKNYRVIEKIKTAKRNGNYPPQPLGQPPARHR